MKHIFVVLLLVCMVCASVGVSIASTVDVYYPNNNTTTEMYYATDAGYNTVFANNISGDFSCLIIRNDAEYDNIIESPHKVISPMFSLIMIIILISFIILVAKMIKYVWRN